MSKPEEIQLESAEQRVSYGFGWQFGQQLQRNRFDGLDVEAVCAALRRCFAGDPCPLSDEELNQAYDTIKEQRLAQQKELETKTRELGQRFLEENAKREGVLTTESGLQYEILEASVGASPKATDTVRVHYHGTFITGQAFDSSVTRNEPAEFALNQVIPGWTEILQMMPVGSKWRVAVPAQLAYGEAGSPPVIPGNSTLVFEIHLLEIL